MTLRQQLERLIGDWDGSDATTRIENRSKLVAEIESIVQSNSASRPASAARRSPAQRDAQQASAA